MASDLGIKAKKTLEEFVPVIDKKLAVLWDQEIQNDFGFNVKQKEVVRELLMHSKEHNLRPSKRIRGSFVNYGYMLGREVIDERVWNAAMGVELIHTALLMHDDFMDRDDTRRGKPTTHRYYESLYRASAHYGETMAVGVGDGVLCLGFELVWKTGNSEAVGQVLRGIANTAFGQAYDVTLEQLGDWVEEDVITLHRAKTGIYTYENPLLIGAHLAGIEGEAINILKDFAADGGVAFQLQDDILGVYGTPEKTGKSADSDLKQGKCTLMVLKAFELGSEVQKQVVRKVWGDAEATRESLDAAKQAMIDCGAYEYNKRVASEYAAKAAKTAEKLRDLDLNSEAIDYIQGVAEYMVEREV